MRTSYYQIYLQIVDVRPTLLSRQTNPPRQQRLAHVIGMREVKHSVTDQYHQLVMFATKCARERLVLSFHDYAFSDPLPELLLGGPELFAVTTHDQRCIVFLFFVFFLIACE